LTIGDDMSRDHLGDLLSALVDGELAPSARETVERHLASCPACRAERDMAFRMHELVAALPLLDPPSAVWTALMTDRARPRPALIWAGVAAAVIGLSLLAASPARHRVTPAPVRTVAFTTIPVVAGAVAPDQPVPALDAPFLAPQQLTGGYELVSVTRHNGAVRVDYTDGVHRLSVFEQAGALDASHLPPAARTVAVGAAHGLSYDWQGGQLVTWQSGHTIYSVVGDDTPSIVLEAARSLPPGRSLAMFQRVRLASRGLLEQLTGTP
jgi:hypothetical protein